MNTQAKAKPAWFEEAVFYEIYPQSFYDSNGDGIGDINGIRQKLDYIRSLGVNAVWLNPCFVSPFQDAGYDVSDYCQVAPRYGSNDDMRALLAEARQAGIRVLLDLVPGHTSIEHPWFKASCRQARNEFSDWYIWTGSNWTWNLPDLRLISGYAERNACYVTNFFYCQPALNYGFACTDSHQPWQQPVDAPGPQRVRQELRNIMQFWLDMGASGFRVDMAFSLVKNDAGRRETIKLWQDVRAWLDRDYPEAGLVAEWGYPIEAIEAGFHADFTLSFEVPGYTALWRKPYGPGPAHDPYGFSVFDSSGHGNVRQFLDDYLKHYQITRGRGQIALMTGNHDLNPRISQGRTADDMGLIYLFLLTMPGTPFIYYGDEIGMRTIEGLPSKEGGYERTAVRTPMQWDHSPNAGFSTALPDQLYLPIDPRADRPTVADQEADARSLLQRVRRLVALRKAHTALCASGHFEPVYAEAGKWPFVYRRSMGQECILVALNPAGRPCELELETSLVKRQPETLYGPVDAFISDGNRWRLRLPAVSGGVYSE